MVTDDKEFDSMTDDELWEYVEASDHEVILGLMGPGMGQGVVEGRVVVGEAQLRAAKAAVLERAGVDLLFEDEILPLGRVDIREVRLARGHDFGLARSPRRAGP